MECGRSARVRLLGVDMTDCWCCQYHLLGGIVALPECRDDQSPYAQENGQQRQRIVDGIFTLLYIERAVEAGSNAGANLVAINPQQIFLRTGQSCQDWSWKNEREAKSQAKGIHQPISQDTGRGTATRITGEKSVLAIGKAWIIKRQDSGLFIIDWRPER